MAYCCLSCWDKQKAAGWRGHTQILDGWHHRPFVNLCVVKSSQTCPHPVSTDANTYLGAIRRPQYVTSLSWPVGHLQPARMWPKTTPKQNWPSVWGPDTHWLLRVGSRDAWVYPWCRWRPSGGGPLECPWQGCGRQFPAGMPCHGSGSQSPRHFLVLSDQHS